jgi:hypothetical protein
MDFFNPSAKIRIISLNHSHKYKKLLKKFRFYGNNKYFCKSEQD